MTKIIQMLRQGKPWVTRLGPVRLVLSFQAASSSGQQTGVLRYQCNICGQTCETPMLALTREAATCLTCGSSARARAIVYLLAVGLFDKSLALPNFPHRPDVHGLGLTDWDGYAGPLARVVSYTNTQYELKPRLDITAIAPALEGTLDFLIASEVFEHVRPPVSVAFANAYRLLKPGGLLILTVPFRPAGGTLEHYPELFHHRIEKKGGRLSLINVTQAGREQVFDNLVFHGGPDATLEMRVFSRASLQQNLADAGFRQIIFHAEPVFEYGIYWRTNASVPVTAQK